MTYYHNLKPSIEATMGDFTAVTSYDVVNGNILVEYQNAETGATIRQILQAIIPDENFDNHIFLALKDIDDVIIEESLWNIEEMREQMERLG